VSQFCQISGLDTDDLGHSAGEHPFYQNSYFHINPPLFLKVVKVFFMYPPYLGTASVFDIADLSSPIKKAAASKVFMKAKPAKWIGSFISCHQFLK